MRHLTEHRTSIIALAAAVLVAAGAALSLTGATGAGAGPGVREHGPSTAQSERFVVWIEEKDSTFVDVGEPDFSSGDMFVGRGVLERRDGTRIGEIQSSCQTTSMSRGTGQCRTSYRLFGRGWLELAEGQWPTDVNRSVIIGGTGDFLGAEGVAVYRVQEGQNRLRVHVRILP
jgi:hypothetical protein